MAPKWMYLQYLQHLVTYTDSDLALALLAIAERNLQWPCASHAPKLERM